MITTIKNWEVVREREEIKVMSIVYLAVFTTMIIAILAITSIFNLSLGERQVMIISSVSTLLIMYIFKFIQIKFG